MQIKKPSRILWISIALGLCFDLLFWKKPVGISYFLFVFVLIAAGFVLAYLEGRKPAGLTWLMAGITLFFSAMIFIREEPFTTFINVLLSLIGLGLLALTFSSGLWIRYSLADMVTGIARLVSGTLAGGSSLLATSRKMEVEDQKDVYVPKKPKAISFWAIFRGVLLAFPIVFFLALLLVSADPVFSKELERILDIKKFMEYAVRLAMVGIIGYLLSGIYLYSLEKSHRSDLIGMDKPWFPAFLGFTESAIVLGSVNILFAFFVVVQFKYFFGGQTNIVVDGFTYAEYARRGFGELIAVAILSLILFLGLSAVTRRESPGKQKWFTGLGLVLVCLVAVILVSSFQRLSLLEAAYGFTRSRTYSHIFMVWLGILLAAVIVLEIINYRRGFAMAALIVLVGFGATLNFINIDGFIVRANVERARAGEELDYMYFQELSTDSIPQALSEFRATNDPEVKTLLGVSMVCRSAEMEGHLDKWEWTGFNISYNTAVNVLREAAPEFKEYQLIENTEGGWRANTVKTPFGEKDCYKSYQDMD